MATLFQTLIIEQGGSEEQVEMLDALGMTAWTDMGSTSSMLGADVVPTELQQLEVEKLAKRLKAGGGGWFSPGKSGGTPRGETSQAGNSVDGSEEDDGDGDEESVDPSSFDLLSKPRVVVFEGKVQRRQTSSFKRKSKRYLILLNDLLLITSAKKSLLGGAPKFAVHSIIPLDELAVRPYWTSEENAIKLQAQASTKGAHDPISCLLDDNSKFPQAFELLSANKQFQFIAESDSDKRVWIETLTSAIFAYCLSAGKAGKHFPGWQHLRRRGTLASAAMRGEMQEVSYLLRKESSLCTGLSRGDDALNTADETGLSALHWAALSGNVKIVEELIESGASVDALNSALNSPLQLAAACGHTDIVLLLLEHGADATCKNLKDRDAAYTALVYAHKSPALTVIVDALASHGCFLDDLDCRGYGALHEAAKRGLLSSVVALHVNHCDMNLVVGATVLSGFSLRASTLSFMPGVSMPSSAMTAMTIESDSASSKQTPVLMSPPSSPQRTLASSSSSLYSSSLTSTMASPHVPHGQRSSTLGLTALLLACSSPSPDAEVVRVLLEMGSHPNRKTFAPPPAQGGPLILLNGIDLLLRSFADRYSVLRKTTLSPDGVWVVESTTTTATTESSSSDKTESANRSSGRDEVAEFVQDFLPSIMELAKKGCRPSDAALKGLRPSLSEAIMGARHHFLYHPIKEPDFLSLVAPGLAPMQKHHEGWSDDKSSSSCLCCGDAFSVLSTRRHHCRLCGVLCCAACSSKSIPVPLGSSSGGTGGGGDRTAALRVCDSCYNEKVFLLECRLDDLAKAPPRASKDYESSLSGRPLQAAAAPTPPVSSRTDAACEPASNAVRPLSTETGDGALAPANSKPSSSSLFSWAGRTSDKRKLLSGSKPTTAAAPEATVATASSTASEALDALRERGQKLGELADKSAELSDESHQFHDAAAQLRKQMQKRANGWGL